MHIYGIRSVRLFSEQAQTQEVGIKAKELGMSKVMVVTEQALMGFKVATQVTEVLEKEGLEVFVFAKMPGRCTERNLR